jgi:hypothetical protein
MTFGLGMTFPLNTNSSSPFAGLTNRFATQSEKSGGSRTNKSRFNAIEKSESNFTRHGMPGVQHFLVAVIFVTIFSLQSFSRLLGVVRIRKRAHAENPFYYVGL